MITVPDAFLVVAIPVRPSSVILVVSLRPLRMVAVLAIARRLVRRVSIVVAHPSVCTLRPLVGYSGRFSISVGVRSSPSSSECVYGLSSRPSVCFPPFLALRLLRLLQPLSGYSDRFSALPAALQLRRPASRPLFDHWCGRRLLAPPAFSVYVLAVVTPSLRYGLRHRLCRR